MIAIVDYGVGNLRSVYKSFETVASPLGIQVDIVDHPVDFSRWRALVLPGQGAFGDSVNNLRRQGFEAPLLDSVAAGLPLLGICVGMQMLFDESEEMGVHEGLHLIPGRVRRFPDKMPDPHRSGRSLRIPQIGWNQLHRQRPDPLLAGVPDGAYGYFAHSYYCDAAQRDAVLTLTDYGQVQDIFFPFAMTLSDGQGAQYLALAYSEVSISADLQTSLFRLGSLAGVQEIDMDAYRLHSP